MLSSFTALRDFRAAWKELDQANFHTTGRFKCNAKICYSAPIGIFNDDAHVEIVFGGYDDGQLDIEETDKLRVTELHLRFSPHFQSYIFDEDSDTLVIEGRSSKVGGEYMVRIHPRGPNEP